MVWAGGKPENAQFVVSVSAFRPGAFGVEPCRAPRGATRTGLDATIAGVTFSSLAVNVKVLTDGTEKWGAGAVSLSLIAPAALAVVLASTFALLVTSTWELGA